MALPVEIIDLIIEHLEGDYPTLAAVALSNRHLCEQSRPLLYSSVFTWNPSERRRGPPVSAFVADPKFSQYLHSLIFYSESREDEIWVFLKPGPIFNSMRNLKELDVATSPEGPPDDILIGNCPFKLKVFCWNRAVAADEFSGLIKFLEQQDELEYLAADQSFPRKEDLPYPASLLPTFGKKLKYLHGNIGIIETVLPGRRIPTLIWNPLSGDPRRAPQNVVEELGFVIAFSHCSTALALPFTDLRHFFPSLQFLELVDGDFDVDYEAISDLPSLVGLILRPYTILQLSVAQLRDIFLRCPKLKFVDVEKRDVNRHVPYKEKRCFDRWMWDPRNEGSYPSIQDTILEYVDFAQHVRDWVSKN
ncbi:hypothetical protein NLJ89_g7590 [Agrocybe chaxingu]|uniref:Uncharacterized protein n=1 Tax=Agrocybe chaxingu TaxID=84603 RepID=A0A9W8JYW5_9AGAR|nr:hypothetical protein NLJ89_g7590 [Agrocybe chaxingu]